MARSRIARLVARHPLSVFFCLAYALAWFVTVPMVAFEGPIELTVLASFSPTVAALVTHRVATGSYRAFRIFTGWRHVRVGAVLGAVLVVLAFVVLPAATANPRTIKWSILVSLGVYSSSTLLGGPLGEEPGWRGYALPQMEARFGPGFATLLLAVLWAGWHAPLFLYPGWTSAPPWAYVLIVFGLSVILTLGTNLARFSILAPIAIHATFNTVSRLLPGLFAEAQPVVQIPFTVVLAVSGVAVAGLLLLVTRGRLGLPLLSRDGFPHRR
jgi:membrane protease YdiL (CAAX protease family)